MADLDSPGKAPGPGDARLNFSAILPISWQRDYLTSKLCNMTEACLHG